MTAISPFFFERPIERCGRSVGLTKADRSFFFLLPLRSLQPKLVTVLVIVVFFEIVIFQISTYSIQILSS